MQRALSAQGQERSLSDFAIFDATIPSEQTIIGRVIEGERDVRYVGRP